MTYRIGPHSTADDASRYRDDAEVAAWRERDPIERFRRYLTAAGIIDDAFVARCEADARAWVDDVRERLVAIGAPPATEVFDHVYSRPTDELLRQRREATGA